METTVTFSFYLSFLYRKYETYFLISGYKSKSSRKHLKTMLWIRSWLDKIEKGTYFFYSSQEHTSSPFLTSLCKTNNIFNFKTEKKIKDLLHFFLLKIHWKKYELLPLDWWKQHFPKTKRKEKREEERGGGGEKGSEGEGREEREDKRERVFLSNLSFQLCFPWLLDIVMIYTMKKDHWLLIVLDCRYITLDHIKLPSFVLPKCHKLAICITVPNLI